MMKLVSKNKKIVLEGPQNPPYPFLSGKDKVITNEQPVNPPTKPLSGKDEIVEQPVNPPKPALAPQTPGLPAWAKDYTSCLSQMGKILPTKSNEQVVIVDGQIKNFFLKNSTYVIKVGNDEVRGKWECVSGNLIIALTNGNSWSKKTGWVGDYSPFKDGSNNKNTQAPQTPGLPAWAKDYTSCLSQMGKILPTKSNEQVVIVDGQIKNFFLKNSTYVIKVGNDEVRGKWECVLGNLIIALTNGNTWTKKTGWKSDYSPFKDGSNNKNTQTDTPNQTKSKYSDCPNTLPIKQYCRNKTIKQVQACLGMPQKYQTGNFGPITQKYLKDAGLDVDKLITQETIETVCKKQPNTSNIQQPNTSNIQQPNTSNIQQPSDNKTQSEKKQPQSITGYEDYTTDEIEYSQPKTSEPSKPPKQNSEPPNNDAPEKDALPYRKYA